MKTNIYIDGFNLYYCGVKATTDKWLNPLVLVNTLFPGKPINKIYYFTARVKPLPHDLSAPTRQGIYWRALRTIPNLEIIEGHFSTWAKLLPQYPFAYLKPMDAPYNYPQKVQIHKAEEKGSDVNLASQLIYDNCKKYTDESIVISNDSDLAYAVEIVVSKLNMPVIVVNPNRTSNVHKSINSYGISKDLKKVASSCMASINDPVYTKSKFPINLTDTTGTFTKPPNW